MALVRCRDCHYEISTTAFACPKCGASVPAPSTPSKWPWIIGIPVALFIGVMIYGSTIPEYRSTAREARDLCEQMVKKGRGDPNSCAEVYRNIIADGEEAEKAEKQAILEARKAERAERQGSSRETAN
jgi:hypothetical protein